MNKIQRAFCIIAQRLRLRSSGMFSRTLLSIFGNSISIGQNKLDIHLSTIWSSVIRIRGSNNSIVVGKEKWGYLEDCSICIKGNNNRVIIGSQVHILGTDIDIIGDNCLVQISDNCTFNGKAYQRNLLLCRDAPTEIVIGPDCMLSYAVELRTSDSHGIFNSAGAQINQPSSIRIGEHVWIGARVSVLKGASIEGGSVVGSGAIVRGSVPPNVIAIGQPAKPVREQIEWRR